MPGTKPNFPSDENINGGNSTADRLSRVIMQIGRFLASR
jgi:hypothetical protein